jgi:hypothetical protein
VGDEPDELGFLYRGRTLVINTREFAAIEPKIDDAIWRLHVALRPAMPKDEILEPLATLNELLVELFRENDEPARDIKLTPIEMEAVLMALKGGPQVRRRDDAPAGPLEIDSPRRLLTVLLARSRRQLRLSMERLLPYTSYGRGEKASE